ncbi:MAG: hypothetical protein JWQ35_1177 [Bacteriovoracaceae bacterium]|nr:hypothetical protein [Bacteriovoracaceae bacterium]
MKKISLLIHLVLFSMVFVRPTFAQENVNADPKVKELTAELETKKKLRDADLQFYTAMESGLTDAELLFAEIKKGDPQLSESKKATLETKMEKIITNYKDSIASSKSSLAAYDKDITDLENKLVIAVTLAEARGLKRIIQNTNTPPGTNVISSPHLKPQANQPSAGVTKDLAETPKWRGYPLYLRE